MLDKDATSDPHPSLWKPKNGHSYKHQTVTARVCTPCQTPILSLKWPYICKNPAVLPWFMHVPWQSEPEVCLSLQEATPSAFQPESESGLGL